MPKTRNHSIPVRIQALTLKAVGISNRAISDHLGISDRGFLSLVVKAKSQGWDPSVSIIVHEHHVADSAKSGRPKNLTKEQEIQIVRTAKEAAERAERGEAEMRSLRDIGREFGCSGATVARVLGVTGRLGRKRRKPEEMCVNGASLSNSKAAKAERAAARAAKKAAKGNGGGMSVAVVEERNVAVSQEVASIAADALGREDQHDVMEISSVDSSEAEEEEEEEEEEEREGNEFEAGREREQDFETHLHTELMSWASKTSASLASHSGGRGIGS